MSEKKKHIAIAGAGLVGSLLAIYLAKRGYRVTIFERRSDLRIAASDDNRSINLALSTRGLHALEKVGLAAAAKKIAIPMHGRMMHDIHGNLTFLAYGSHGQYINSISRSGLNRILMDEAEANGASIEFHQRCVATGFGDTTLSLQDERSGQVRTLSFDGIVGADGAFSAVRSAMQITDRFDYSQYYLAHGYKELTIPPGSNGSFALEKEALHIWPRESYMMIALPNPDGSFTCTLFFPFEGARSFASLSDDQKILAFFRENFPDALRHIPDLLGEYRHNPTSSLVTIRCYPWVRGRTLLIGDAAHGIVPFYGQGMNAGFEDCNLLNTLLDHFDDDWQRVLSAFQEQRKPDTDAIAQLAFDNFIEMRDHVADPEFLLRKKIEARLHELFPDRWIPLYSMVTFRQDISYAQAHATGMRQKSIMDRVMERPGIAGHWQDLDFREIVDQLAM